jgi:predicted murein hydrolase (TIGR00659 family)
MTAIRLAHAALWIAVTVAGFHAATKIHVRARSHPLANAVVMTVALLTAILIATRTPYAIYAECTRPIALLLGPATVALALPLYRSLDTLRSAVRPVLIGVVAGGAVASASAVLLARALGASPVTVRSLAPKSVTTPIAMAIAARIDGNASLTAVFVIVTGMIGAMSVPWIFQWIGVRDARARGLAIGVAAHGLGTARALMLGGTEGAFAALGMGLSALLTPIALPVAMRLFG